MSLNQFKSILAAKSIVALHSQAFSLPCTPLTERRADARVPCSPGTTARLTVLDQTASALTVVVKDVSKKGIGVIASSQLHPDCCVRVDVSDHMLLGNVVYCIESGSEFDVGIRLEHSLDLTAVAELTAAFGSRA
jgi:hypothetical protein